jgi:hypothetical protein
MTQDVHHHDAFVSTGLTMEELRQRLEARLGVTFELHESSYWNGAYDLHPVDGHSEIRLIGNGPDPHGELWFADHPAEAVIALVESTPATRHLPEAVAGIDGIVLREHREGAPASPRPVTSGPAGRAADVFGSATMSAREVFEKVSPLLTWQWRPMVSDAPGERWTARSELDENLLLADNTDWFARAGRSRLDHPGMLALLEIGDTTRSDALRDLLTSVEGLVHLSHEEY